MGIGTESPAATLDIVGNLKASNINSGNSSTDLNNASVVSKTSSDLILAGGTLNERAVIRGTHLNNGNTALRFMTRQSSLGGTIDSQIRTRMYIGNDGKVGIGTEKLFKFYRNILLSVT